MGPLKSPHWFHMGKWVAKWKKAGVVIVCLIMCLRLSCRPSEVVPDSDRRDEEGDDRQSLIASQLSPSDDNHAFEQEEEEEANHLGNMQSDTSVKG